MILNRQQIAEEFEVTPPTIDRWVSQGCPVTKRGGKGVPSEFDTVAVREWVFQRRITEKSAALTDAEEAKARKLCAEAELAELALAKARAEVAPLAEIERAQSRLMAAIQANVMNVASRACLQLLGETDETVFKTKLRAELALALEQSAGADLDDTPADESLDE